MLKHSFSKLRFIVCGRPRLALNGKKIVDIHETQNLKSQVKEKPVQLTLKAVGKASMKKTYKIRIMFRVAALFVIRKKKK